MSDFTILNENREKGITKATIKFSEGVLKLIWGNYQVVFLPGDSMNNFLDSVNVDYSDLPTEIEVDGSIDEYFLVDTVDECRINKEG